MKKLILLCVVFCFGFGTSKQILDKHDRIVNIQKQVLNEENALDVTINYGTDVVRVRGKLGISLPASAGAWSQCEGNNPGEECIQWGDFAQVIIKEGSAPGCDRVEWISHYARELEDCFDLEENIHWYGAGERAYQTWPIENNPQENVPYVTGGHGIIEHYWLLSNGAALHIDEDTPLFYTMNSGNRPNRVCFVARDAEPFARRSPLTLNYEWCTGADVKETHLQAISTFYEKPTSLPDEGMLLRPFWSTWAQYFEDVNQTLVVEYAKRVISEGFVNSSHIQIDDDWETCYGEEDWNRNKFPNPKAMVDEIRDELNLRVTLWAHPFVNLECPLFMEGAEKGYFVKSSNDRVGMTSWWQGANCGLIDVTNPDAVEWWYARLDKIKEETGIVAFKFDAGETNLVPPLPKLNTDSKFSPSAYSTKHVETIAAYGGLGEVRVAHRNQKLPIFYRMGDKDSRWGYDNGLRSLIPALFHHGIVGYPFVLPDMIGGNAYQGRPSKELYIRWMQANVLMPSVQFSIVPWDFDNETVQICLKVLEIRERFKEDVLAAARQSTQDFSPINRPLWWVDPTDSVTFTIDDEYMVGDSVLVAPIVDEGSTSRDIYLPQGMWTSIRGEILYEGKQWLRDYQVPLDSVAIFMSVERK